MCHANFNQKKTGVAMLISDKIDLRAKKMTRPKRNLHNDKKVNPPRRHSNDMCICIK